MKRTYATRSSQRNVIRSTHRQTSEMHRAIGNKDFKTVRRLLGSGEKLCLGDGVNCFILAAAAGSKQFLKKLLELEPEGANVKSFDNRTLLLYFLHDVEMINYMIHLGAVSFTENNDTLLIKAVTLSSLSAKPDYEKLRQIFNILLQAGANLLAQNENGCTVLCETLRTLKTSPNSCAPSVFLQFIINQAAFQSETFTLNCSSVHFQPQYLLLTNSSVNCVSNKDIYDVFFNSKFKDLNAIYYSRAVAGCRVPLNVISFSIQMPDLIQALICYGFSVSSPPLGLSPLTHFISTCLSATTVEEEDTVYKVSFMQYLIEQGVNVQQKLLISGNATVEAWRDEFFIPDVLWQAFVNCGYKTEFVEMLLPYVVCHPLVLLLTLPNLGDDIATFWLAVFAKYGPLPHGSRAYQLLYALLHDDATAGAQFKNLHGNVLSLRDTCRYHVRLSLGAAVSRPDNTLDGLVYDLVPPGLRDFVLYKNV